MRALIAASLIAVSAPATAGSITDRIYPAPKAPLSLAGLPAGDRLIEVRTADGLALKGTAITARDGLPTLLMFHGNGSSAADSVRWFEPLIKRGYGLVAAEYRGYSGNPGTPDEAGLLTDAAAFLAAGRAQARDGALWVVGHSLGGGVALGLGSRAPVDALITIGAFTRLRAMAPKLARAFVPDAYDNRGALKRITAPYFLVHGASDSVVPIDEGRMLHDAAGAAGRAGASFVIMGADHKPDAIQLLPVFETIRARLGGGALSASRLPNEVKLVPFGQMQPLNP